MTNPLISVAGLRRLLEDPGTRPVLLDVRYQLGGPTGIEEFAAGHLPGAAYVDLDTELAAPPGSGGRHPLPDSAVFVAAMRRAGVRNESGVVVYDDWAGRAASRCWWLLRHHGHTDVRVLDGGLAAWRGAGGELETGLAQPAAGDFTGEPGHLPVVDVDAVLRVARDGLLLDARDAERYRGDVEPVDPVAGHVPGAANVPTGDNLRSDGAFRPPDELREVYADALADDPEVAVYCGSGVTACHDVLALAAIGVEAALYPGSWSHWVTDPARPVARS